MNVMLSSSPSVPLGHVHSLSTPFGVGHSVQRCGTMTRLILLAALPNRTSTHRMPHDASPKLLP